MKKMLLTYNFNQERLSKIKRSAIPLKISVRNVEKSEYSQLLGTLAGMKEMPSSASENNAISFDDEMLVMCGFDRNDLDTLLRAMNKNGVGRIPLKAILTPTNILWNSIQLHDAVKADHEEMSQRHSSFSD
ncbi:MAG: DUF3783 domain-containing protein [Clostridia bacterium]|nr:DUF3783 domain-containing protein [Clostridia bacterium]